MDAAWPLKSRERKKESKSYITMGDAVQFALLMRDGTARPSHALALRIVCILHAELVAVS
jgi:hypothetical protein